MSVRGNRTIKKYSHRDIIKCKGMCIKNVNRNTERTPESSRNSDGALIRHTTYSAAAVVSDTNARSGAPSNNDW